MFASSFWTSKTVRLDHGAQRLRIPVRLTGWVGASRFSRSLQQHSGLWIPSRNRCDGDELHDRDSAYQEPRIDWYRIRRSRQDHKTTRCTSMRIVPSEESPMRCRGRSSLWKLPLGQCYLRCPRESQAKVSISKIISTVQQPQIQKLPIAS